MTPTRAPFSDARRSGPGVLWLAVVISSLAPALAATAQDPVRRHRRFAVQEGEFWLHPIVQVRERFELRLSRYVAPAAGEDGEVDAYFVNSRVRLGADTRWRSLRAYVLFQDARNLGTDTSGATDLQQGFVSVSGNYGWVRLGRQQIRWGTQRLVGAAPFGPGRAFDALRGRLQVGSLAVDAFGAWLVAQPGVGITELADHPGSLLFGTRLEFSDSPTFHFEPAVLYRFDGPGAGGPPGGRPVGTEDAERNVATLAVHVHGRVESFKYDANVMAQVGEGFDRDLHLALAAAGWVGYRFDRTARFELRLHGSIGSGRTQRGGLDEFDNLFPANHRIYGLIDNASLANMGTLRLVGSAAPRGSKVRIDLAVLGLVLPESGSPWRGHNGRLLGQNAANTANLLGAEVDATVRWTPDPALALQLDYALFIPGPAADALGHEALSHMVLASVEAVLP